MDKQPTGILLINKDLALIEFAVKNLEDAGYPIHTASTMRDALGAINQSQVGLILCGFELEDITGEQFLSYLKNDPLRENIPFIFFLSVDNQKKISPKRAIVMGAEDLIFFPIDAATLVSRIKETFQPPMDVGSDQPATSSQPETKPEVNTPIPSAADKRPPQKVKSPKEEIKQPAVPVAVDVSRDGKSWEPGVIINTSKTGAVVETATLIGYGDDILIRKAKDEGGCVAGASIAHVLQGETSDQIGVGVIFHTDGRWADLAKRLAETDTESDVGSVKQELFPIKVDVSRDGLLWVDAQISGCDAASARIKTLLLGKPDEEMRVKFELEEIKDIIPGRIKTVELENEEMLANIELDFDDDSGWFMVFAQLSSMTDSESSKKDSAAAERRKTAARTPGDVADEDLSGENWAKTVLLEEASDEKLESSIPKAAKKTSKVANERFYKSLIGRKMDNYEVVSYISSGAMGGVFKGFDTALERDVALKVISWKLASQEKFVEMFFKEARFVSKLNHSNISQIYHIGDSNGIIYYAMEFVHGYNFLELNKRKVRFQLDEVVGYLRTICSTLDYVWKNKIIHRDIKPANIMLTSDDILKIVDFGVAKFEQKDKTKKEAKIVGSPLYLSPEAIRNQKVDFRSDIYSLGATFYHMMAGTPPYIDISLNKILKKHLHDPVPTLKTTIPGIPDNLSDLLERMMAKEPEDRFESYQEIIETLNSF
jgi:CheY-like chemotaxis protein/predicted Ser/Thr protein kinase